MKHQGSKTLYTDRLILRKACLQDAAMMYRNYARQPEVSKYLTWLPHQSVEASESFIKDVLLVNYEKEDTYEWLIELKSIGEIIGSISVVKIEEHIAGVHMGYCIGSKWWHQGIVSEALHEVMTFLFEQVDVNRICAQHDVHNPNSGKVMIKCGMRFEGINRQSGLTNQGTYCDLATYAILKEDYYQKES